MSVMRCDTCDRYIDTDYDVEGFWGIEHDTGPDFICGGCMETRCPECGADESCYACASSGGWAPEPDGRPEP